MKKYIIILIIIVSCKSILLAQFEGTDGKGFWGNNITSANGQPVNPYCENNLFFNNGDLYFNDNITIKNSLFLTAKGNGIITNGKSGVDRTVLIKGTNVTDYNLLSDIDFADVGDVDLRAGQQGSVVLRPGFKAEMGCYMHAYISPTWQLNSSNSYNFSDPNEYPPYNENHTIANPMTTALSNQWNFQSAGDVTINDDPFNNGDYNSFTIKRSPQCVAIKSITEPGAGGRTTQALAMESWPQIINGQPQIFDGGLVANFHQRSKNQPYGRYDISCMVTNNPRYFTALWFMSQPGYGGGTGTEVDIFERSIDQLNSSHNGVLLYRPEAIQRTGGSFWLVDNNNQPVSINKFHVYSYEVEEDVLRFLVDDYVVLRLPCNAKHRGFNFPKRITKEPPEWIFWFFHWTDGINRSRNDSGLRDKFNNQFSALGLSNDYDRLNAGMYIEYLNVSDLISYW